MYSGSFGVRTSPQAWNVQTSPECLDPPSKLQPVCSLASWCSFHQSFVLRLFSGISGDLMFDRNFVGTCVLLITWRVKLMWIHTFCNQWHLSPLSPFVKRFRSFILMTLDMWQLASGEAGYVARVWVYKSNSWGLYICMFDNQRIFIQCDRGSHDDLLRQFKLSRCICSAFSNR